MKKRLTNILTGLMMVAAMALTISACGGGDDGSSATNNNNNGGNGSPGQGGSTMEQLVGTWQAIQAQGTVNWRTVNTKEIYGIDSLHVPAVLTVNANNTYISYCASFPYESYRYINGIIVPMGNIWYQEGNRGGNGEGSILLIGNSLQLNDSRGNDFSYSLTISSLTSNRLTLRLNEGSTDVSVTYGRNGDGAEYYKYPYINHNPSFVGSWTLTESTDRTAPIGSTYTFNSNGLLCWLECIFYLHAVEYGRVHA